MNILTDAYYSLARNINKLRGREDNLETQEGVVSPKYPELELDMPNDELARLGKLWEKTWIQSKVYTEWQEKSEENEKYWLGQQFEQPKIGKQRQLVDNVLFEALETYLPQTTQHNPEPMVTLATGEEQSSENLDFANTVKKKLADIADTIRLRLKLKKAARHWAIYLVGAVKMGWDMERDIPTSKVIRAAKLILDPNATVDEDGYTGSYYGEHRKLAADVMLDIIENVGGEEGAKVAIEKLAVDADGNPALGTELGFIEWWTNTYMCWQLGDDILLKKKNPHWNYEHEEPAPANEQGEVPIDESGEEQKISVPGFNHFPVPKMPLILLSVFNLGKQPIDDTSFFTQNLANQDLINKRLVQIDKNADSQNGGMVVSGERAGMTQQQAKGVTEAVRKGGTVYIPSGAVNEAIARLSAPALPADIYQQLQDTRMRVQYVFGTKGFTPSGSGSGISAVRMQMINQNLDQARIGGGFSEYLEQLADDIYNWMVQLMYVYDDTLRDQQHPKIVVGVKEGSLLPKDAGSLATQAMDLAKSGKMALVDLYKKLDYANPEEMAANVWLEANAPEILLGGDSRVQQAIQAKQQAAGGKPPATSINFKDLPPEGKAQLAKEAGIELHPEAIAAHDEHSAAMERSSPPAPAVPNIPTSGQ